MTYIAPEASDFQISREKVVKTRDGVYEFSWVADPNVSSVDIFAATRPDRIDWQAPLARVEGQSSARLDDLDDRQRYYFALVPKDGRPVILATRHVRLEGTVNTRDLGGYATSDGRRVKWGRIFRSDALSRLTDNDRQRLINMGLRTVIDLRSTQEAETSPDLLGDPPLAEYLHLPIQSGEMNYVAAMDRLKSGDADWLTEEYMCQGYLKNLDDFGGLWFDFFSKIADPEARPALFHCTGGKDRAGTAAALILLFLGVPEETVITDHQLSNRYIATVLNFLYEKVESYGVPREKAEPYFTAPLTAIRRLINHVNSCYGSVDQYLIDQSGLSADTLNRFREDLLE
jgi:protein-tyrosine phosphatase